MTPLRRVRSARPPPSPRPPTIAGALAAAAVLPIATAAFKKRRVERELDGVALARAGRRSLMAIQYDDPFVGVVGWRGKAPIERPLALAWEGLPGAEWTDDELRAAGVRPGRWALYGQF